MRCKGLSGSGVCWHQDDDQEMGRESKLDGLRRRGKGLLRRSAMRHVRARITRTKRPHRKASNIDPGSVDMGSSSKPPLSFRYEKPRLPLEELPTLALEIPDFELWINEFWNEFLIEPTPYLAVSAMLYLGGILLLAHYHEAVWRLWGLFFYFIPWDDEHSLRIV